MANQDEGYFDGPREAHKRALYRAKGLVAADVTIKPKAFLRYATGSIKNRGEHEFSYLTLKIDLLDKNGKLVGNAADGVQNLRPGQMWNFEIGISSGEGVTAKIGEIKGWFQARLRAGPLPFENVRPLFFHCRITPYSEAHSAPLGINHHGTVRQNKDTNRWGQSPPSSYA